MVDLALHYKRGAVAVGAISKREDISTHYLEQILNKLRRSNLVKSIRGPRGGYMLAREPAKIKIGQIVEVLEGEILPVDCGAGKGKKTCQRIDRCVAKLVWLKLNNSIDEVLNSVSLADLMKEAKTLGIDKKLDHGYTFHI